MYCFYDAGNDALWFLCGRDVAYYNFFIVDVRTILSSIV